MTVATAPSPAGSQEIDRKLVLRGRAEAEMAWRRGFTVDNPQIQTRIGEMLRAVAGDQPVDPAIDLEVRIFRSPEINAFALPDGSVFVFAGLLAELESPGELAFVLGHEAQHAIGWHAQKNMAQAKGKLIGLEILSAGASLAIGADTFGAALANSFSQLGLGLIAAASITGYGRDLEREADERGLQMLGAAGYEECHSVHALRALAHEDEPGRVATFFWGSHPLLVDRIEATTEMIGDDCPLDTTRSVDPDYASVKWPMAKMSARLWTDGGAYDEAKELAAAYVETHPDDPEIHNLLGDIHRELAGVAAADTLGDADEETPEHGTVEEHRASALEQYERALELGDGSYSIPYHGLYLLAAAEEDTAQCIDYLEQYLADDSVPRRRKLRRTLAALKDAVEGHSNPGGVD